MCLRLNFEVQSDLLFVTVQLTQTKNKAEKNQDVIKELLDSGA